MRTYNSTLVAIVLTAISIIVISCGVRGYHDDYDSYYYHNDGFYGHNYNDNHYLYRIEQPENSIAPKKTIVAFTNLAFDYCGDEPPIIKITVKRVSIYNNKGAIKEILLIDNPAQTINSPSKISVLATEAEEDSGEGILTFSPEKSCGKINATVAGFMADDTSPYAGEEINLVVTGVTFNGMVHTDIQNTLPIVGTTHTVNSSLNF